MTTKPPASTTAVQEPGDRSMRVTYIWVIVVEAVTLLALWWLQTAFGRP